MPMLLKNHKIKSIDLLDIIGDLFYSLNRSLLARTAIRLVVRALFIPAQLPFSRSYAFCM